MPFIRIFPLQEAEAVRAEGFGLGNPARCHAARRFGAREFWLAISQIVAYEECPLYLICDAEPNGLVNGVRIRLADGGCWWCRMIPMTANPVLPPRWNRPRAGAWSNWAIHAIWRSWSA